MTATGQRSLYLGIDTGGTFTDGVLLDPAARRVIRSAKVRTTHHDLKLCIAEVLENLLTGETAEVELVSLSTTLATNAIVEGKRRPAGLLLMGYDPDLVYKFKFQAQFASPDYYFVSGLHGLDGLERQPLDEAAVLAAGEKLQAQVAALAVCAYGGPVNASHEVRAAELLQPYGLPVVQAHHLSSELNSIRRAATASLNASLLGNTQAFMDAVQAMLEARQVRCPVMIVRGDGSLVRAGFARERPVEIIHSGPATSAIGGVFLTREALASQDDHAGRALVVDIGGTTTDLAVIDGGRPQAFNRAATVGTFQTSIRTIRAHSFGLGGDSRIRFDHWGRLEVGPDRVLPIAYLCHIYPQAKQDLAAEIRARRLLYSDNLEFWLLRRFPDHEPGDDLVRRIVAALSNGPLLFSELRQRAGSIPPFIMQELIEHEIVDRAALTPTDLLHATGEYSPWAGDSSTALISAAAALWNESTPDFIHRVRSVITRRIAAEIIQFLTEKNLSNPEDEVRGGKSSGLDRWLFDESLSPSDPFLGNAIYLKMPLIGIGAPARAFLPPVARVLGTELLLPEHHEVANAVGSVVGSVVFQAEAEVMPYVQGMGIGGYFARVASDQRSFGRYSEALDYARSALAEFVETQARLAGANAITVEVIEKPVWEGMARLSGIAVGQPG